MSASSPLLLKVKDLRVVLENDNVGLKDLTMTISPGEIVGLIGLKGSGKSIALQSIMGLVEKQSGKVEFNGEDIEFFDNVSRIKLGMNLVAQTRKIFKNISVRENLIIGANTIKDADTIHDLAEETLAVFPRLKEKYDVLAGEISSGEQMMLGIAKALMSDPLLLMIDELCLGISPLVRDDIFEKLKFLRDTGLTILIAEQKGYDILEIVDRAYLLDNGRVLTIGSPADYYNNDKYKEMFNVEDER